MNCSLQGSIDGCPFSRSASVQFSIQPSVNCAQQQQQQHFPVDKTLYYIKKLLN